MTQLTGQVCASQLWCASSVGQGAPPWAAEVDTWRKRLCVPPPHVREHANHAPHGLTLQSTGHAAALHTRWPFSDAQARPPCDAWRATARVRVCVPPPHELEHALQALHCAMRQSTGQAASLHDRTPSSCGHTAPPCRACAVTERERVCAPLPHVLVHPPHPDHADTVQCTGHGPASHACDSARPGHAVPPCAGGVTMERARF